MPELPRDTGVARAAAANGRSGTRVLIGLILIVAAVVRFWGIGFGLPHPNTRPDEGAIAAIAGGLFYGDLNPHSFNYPALFPLVVAAVLRILHEGQGLLQDASIPVSLDPLSTTKSYMTARLLSAGAGVASVFVVFCIGRRLFGRDAAIAASAMLALAFLHVRDSHFGVTDVPMTCMVLVGFLYVVRFSQSGSMTDLVVAGLMAGIATSVKYNAALIALPGAFAIVRDLPGGARPFGARLRRVAFYGLAMAAAYLATSPYTVLDFPNFLADVTHESKHLAEGSGPVLGRGWVYHFTATLRYGLGVPMLLAGVFGLVLLVRRDTLAGALVALFMGSYYMLLGSGYTVFARYMLPIVPFLCLTGGYAVVEVGHWLARRIGHPQRSSLVAGVIVLGLVAPSAQSVLAFDRLIARPDSRLLARRWVEARFPAGTPVMQLGAEGGHPFLHDSSEVSYELLEFERGRRPDVVIVQQSPLLPPVDPAYFLERLDANYDLKFKREDTASDPANVYDWQDGFYLPIAGFKGIQRPGPNLSIYVRRDYLAGAP